MGPCLHCEAEVSNSPIAARSSKDRAEIRVMPLLPEVAKAARLGVVVVVVVVVVVIVVVGVVVVLVVVGSSSSGRLRARRPIVSGGGSSSSSDISDQISCAHLHA